jgi:hypothetical protein
MNYPHPPKIILLLAANPKDTDRLRLDQEVRKIHEELERANQRQDFQVISKWAVRPQDLQRAVLGHEPQIIHFSGHGEGESGLLLEDEGGQIQPVNTLALVGLFELCAAYVDCVLLNACYSEVQATAIAQHINWVIGMERAIGDRAAINFAAGFYRALGAGRSYREAYQFGCNAIALENLPESLTPVLKTKPGQIWVESNPLANQSTRFPPPPLATRWESPEGQVPLRSLFYVERPPIETDCYGAIAEPGALIRIKAPRQMGKTSLMTRILAHGANLGYRTVPVYFQEADQEVFSHLDWFLRWFCSTVTIELDLEDKTEAFWQRTSLGSKPKCRNYFQQYLLPQVDTTLVLGLDEVDLIFQHLKIAQDFFALLRTWHERGQNEPLWQKLHLIIVHSQEVYIPLDIRQSPFNVGVAIELPELTLDQVRDLAQRHGIILETRQIQSLMAMLGGHPYLIRVALYELGRQRMTLAQLLQVAATEQGPYVDHLRRHLLNLRDNPNLVQAVNRVIAGTGPVQIGMDESFKLRSMGLVKFQGNAVIPLCELYRCYFRHRLAG